MKIPIQITLFISIFLTSVALAHHGWGGYKDWLDIKVTITTVRLGNPHDRLVGRDSNGDEWNLLLAPPARNRRFGFNEMSVSVGDELDLFGQKHPKRLELKVHCIYRNAEVLYVYRYNSGRTSLQGTGSSRKTC